MRMSTLEIVGSIVRGKHGHLMIRQKSDADIELGDLLVAENPDGHTILQVFDLGYGSLISSRSLEMISGMKVEGYSTDLGFIDQNLRNYIIAEVKALAKIIREDVKLPKTLPKFLNEVRHINNKDLECIEKPKNPIHLGRVRSGSKVLDVEVNINAEEALKHHILIPATTGRGKSNLVKTMVWSLIPNSKIGLLILDPHDEYYGRHDKGLKDHPEASKTLSYYSPKSTPGSIFPVFNLRSIRYSHFRGIIHFTDAQSDALHVASNRYREKWLEAIMKEKELENVAPVTHQVLKRRLSTVLGIYVDENNELRCRTGIFSTTRGETTLSEILIKLEQGDKVIIDTSLFSDQIELLVGSMVLNEVLYRYKRHKQDGILEEKPVLNVIIEEAPRVLGLEAMNRGANIYGDIAREGRKFKLGLTAITQLSSLIPRTVLANMNTKIILGNELKQEREAIIGSASQDLSQDDKNIASLDRGEAILSSTFTKFAIPIQIPLFEEYIEPFINKKLPRIGIVGGN
jgi:DNA helicase HerA-like ATPase